MRFEPQTPEAGVATLFIVVAISLAVVSIGILAAIQGNSSIFAGKSESQAERANFLAETGVQDALMRIARDKSYGGSYTITETDGVISVNIISDSDKTVSSTATVTWQNNTIQRVRSAIVVVASSTGKITSITWQ